MVKRRKEELNDDGHMSMSTARRLSVTMKLTDIQKELCVYFNKCFLESESNPITMARWITERFDVKRKTKKAKRA